MTHPRPWRVDMFWCIEEVVGPGYIRHTTHETKELAEKAILRRFGSASLESGRVRAVRYRTGSGPDGPERYPLSAAEEMGRPRTETPKEETAMSGRNDDRIRTPVDAPTTDAALAAEVREKFRQLYLATARAGKHGLQVCSEGGDSLLGRLCDLGDVDGKRLSISRKL